MSTGPQTDLTQEFNFDNMHADMKILALLALVPTADSDIINVGSGEIKSIICDANEITYNTIRIGFKREFNNIGAVGAIPGIVAILIVVEEKKIAGADKYPLTYRFEKPTTMSFINNELTFN